MVVSTKVTTQQRRRDAWFGLADVSRDLSVDGLIERLVREAGRLCDARRGILDVVDGRADRRLGRFASFGVASDPAGSIVGREELVDLVEHAHAPVGSLPFLGAPVRVDGRVFGNLYLFDHASGTGFTPDDEEVAEAFATSAGLMISTALLHEKSVRDRRWLDASAEIATTLLGPVSHESAWQLVVDRARAVAAASCAILLLPDEDRESLTVAAVSGVEPTGLLGEVVPLAGTLVGRPARTGHAVVVPRTELDRRYDPLVTPGWPALRTVQMLPVHDGSGADAAGFGTLVFGWAGSRLVDSWELDPELPARFAEQAAQVLQAARDQGVRRQLAVVEDRGRISRDLHDVVIQRLFAIGMTLDQAARTSDDPQVSEVLSTAIDGIDETIADLRRTISGLEHDDADSPDVPAVLSRMADDAAELLGFRPSVIFSGPVTTQVSGTIREHVVAVAGEMLSNIVQHAEATEVSIDVTVGDDVTLTIVDDGRGFDPAVGRDGGNGMRNMRRRAELLGGTCEVESAPNRGATITWTVPGDFA
jgi:signal transduction histidine kinase